MDIWPIDWRAPSQYDSLRTLALRRREKANPLWGGAQSSGASYVWEVAGLSKSSSGGVTMLRPYRGDKERMRPNSNENLHTRVTLHSSSLLYGSVYGRSGG